MARVVLDVPSEKIQPFVQMVLALGIEKHRISSNAFQTTSAKEQKNNWFPDVHFRPYSPAWELNKNELEFE